MHVCFFTVSTQLFAHARKPYKCLVSQQFFLIFFFVDFNLKFHDYHPTSNGSNAATMKQCCARRDRYRRREPEIQRMSHDSIQNAEGRMEKKETIKIHWKHARQRNDEKIFSWKILNPLSCSNVNWIVRICVCVLMAMCRIHAEAHPITRTHSSTKVFQKSY